MHTQAREVRHTVLLFLIVVVVPLIFFPSNLGLAFGASVAVYILAELLYFGIVTSVFLDFPGARVTVAAAAICLGFRLCAGVAFGILLFLMNGEKPGAAFAAGLWSYKPAVLLQSLTAPFVLLSLLRSIFIPRNSKREGRFTITPLSETIATARAKTETGHHQKPQPVVIGAGAPAEPFEAPANNFDAAIRHVFALSAVKFCVLFDAEGLPVAFAGDEPALRDIWAPTGCLLSTQIQTGLARVGDLVLEGFHLTLDAYRLHMASVCDMWLLVGADRNSEELEKVRMGQAVEMIKKTFHQKYVEIQPTVVAEESHV